MFDVGEDQFLVLLFVLQTQLYRFCQFSPSGAIQGAALQQGVHALIHGVAPFHDLMQARARQEPALGSRVALAHGVVIAVEEHAKGRVIGLEARLKTLEHEGFKKPGDMGQMPLDRAGIRHGLHLAVLAGQWCRERLSRRPNARKARQQ